MTAMIASGEVRREGHDEGEAQARAEEDPELGDGSLHNRDLHAVPL
jgi:hypothetical protein